MKTRHELILALALGTLVLGGGTAVAGHHATPAPAPTDSAAQLEALMDMGGNDVARIVDLPQLPELLAMLPHE